MAEYTITAPNGGTYKVTAPESASQDDVLAYAKSNFSSGGSNQEAQPAQPQSNPNYEVANQSTSFSGMAPNQAISGTPGPSEAFTQGLLTNQPTQGFAGSMGRALLPTIGGMLAGPAGAGAGEAVHQVLGNANAVANNQEPTGPLGVVGNVAMAAGTQKVADVATPYLSSGISKAGQAIGDFGNSALKYAGVNLQGVKSASYGVAQELGPETVRSFVGAAPEVGDNLAHNVRSVINGAIEEGKQAYPELIAAAKANPEYAGKVFNLQSALGDKVLAIAEDHSFITPAGIKATPSADKFWNFAGQVDNLSNASLDQIYAFQKQLNSLAGENVGTPLGAAFGKLKSAVSGYLGDLVPEIGQANARYAAAKALEDQTGKLANANDLLGFITREYRNPQMTQSREAIETAANNIPGLRDAINQVRAYSAAKDFEPLIRSLPQTGFGAKIVNAAGLGAAAVGGGAVMANPLIAGAGLAGGAALGTLVSPRAALTALSVSRAAEPLAQSGLNLAAKSAGGLTSLAAQAFAHMSPDSISALSAFYRSPGASQ